MPLMSEKGKEVMPDLLVNPMPQECNGSPQAAYALTLREKRQRLPEPQRA
jgi:hypothetical protein